jgi:4-hydroxy-4-methyl-2-oxoglutarate aldolase
MLEDPPLLEIKRNWERLSSEMLARFDGAQAGHLVDAMAGRGALDAAIKPLVANADTLIGSAVPIWTGPDENLALLAAVARAKPGDVLVVAAEGFETSAITGDILAALAKNAGCAGMVLDGMARDLVGLEGVGLPIFGRGITPNSPVKSGPGRVGLPVVAGGIHIEAGDLVFGDRDGVVVVPAAKVEAVADLVDQIRANEAKVIETVEGGLKAFDWVVELIDSDKVRFVD